MSDPITRSGSNYSLPRDSNRIPTLGAVSSADGVTVKPLEVDSSNNLMVNVAAGGGSGGTSSTFGVAFPGTGTAAGASDGTNMKPLLVDASGYLEVNVKAGSGSGLSVTDEATFTAGTSNFVPGGGVFNDSVAALTSGQQGTQRLTPNRGLHINIRNNSGTELATSTNPLQVSLANTAANSTAVKVDGSAVTQPVSLTSTTITGTVAISASSLPLPTGAAADSSVTGLQVAQGSTTSGQKGGLTLGAVTTAAPTYTTAQTSPLSLDTSGNLRTTTILGAGASVIGHVITDTGSTTAVTGTVTISGTVTANAGTNLNTSLLALESGGNLATIVTNTNNLSLAQASTTSGQKGNLILGAVTTAAPSYTTAQSDPLSLTTTGALRVDGSAVTQPVSLTSTTITGTVAVTESGTWNVGLSSGINAIGSITNTSFAATQATAASLNATVVGTGTFAVQATGGTASGSSLSANPLTGGGLAKTANPTAVSDGQVVNQLHDKLGKQVVVGSVRDLKANQVTTITASASETTIVTAVASTFLDMYGLIITNTSATAVNVAIKDATAGTTRLNLAIPAGDTRGFMLPEGGAIKQAAVNNNWTATSSGSVSSLIITALTVQNL